MRRASTILEELDQIHTVEGLTGIFESIASIKIAKLRGRVVASKEFFAELWQTYSGLRVDPKEQLARKHRDKNGRNVLVAVTAEGKLSGEIGASVMKEMLTAYTSPDKTDVVMIGAYGAIQLQQAGIVPTQVFHLPQGDTQANVGEVITLLEQYDQISVFYQTYESLRVQQVARIELVSAVRELSSEVTEAQAGEQAEILSSHDFIFEPGITEIADYLETLMMGVALSQILIESELSQHASRFNAMNSAKHRAGEIRTEYDLLYHRAKRAEEDERIKETMKVIMG